MPIIPASIRNRNPGAMYPGPSATRFGSNRFEVLRSKDGVHKIATFPSNVQGAAALFDLLDRSYTGKTIEAAITRWCGAFYVSTYIKVLEDKGGVKRSDILTKEMIRDPALSIPLAKAMAWQEAGRDFPMTDEEWQQAHACAFQEPVAPAFAPGNDVPSPKPETRRAELMSSVGRVATPVMVGSGTLATAAVSDPAAVAAKLTAYKELATAVTSLGPWLGAAIMAGAAVWWVAKGQ